MKHNIVYKTTNLINEKIYVGKHTQYDTSAFDGYFGSGKLLLEAIEEFGKENFERETLELCKTEFLAYQRENYWANILSATNREIGYNIIPGGQGFNSEELKIIWQNPEHKEYMSKMMKEYWQDIDYKEKTSNAIKLGRNTEEQKIYQSKISKERWDDPEWRNNHIDKIKEGLNKPETKEYHIKMMKERWDDPEYKKKTSKAIKDTHSKSETKEMLSNSLKEFYSIPENREKRSVLSKERWEDPVFREKMRIAANEPELKKKQSKRMKGHKINAKFIFVVKDFCGIVYKFGELKQFCKDFNLDYGKMCSMCNKKIKHYKGWTLISKSLKKRSK